MGKGLMYFFMCPLCTSSQPSENLLSCLQVTMDSIMDRTKERGTCAQYFCPLEIKSLTIIKQQSLNIPPIIQECETA